ncbi:hypothetical protein GRI62_01735 [Erythrobacter arachoides]|uniref:YbgF trimerisation domain-containing protein n=1 Tax=Aurantiacibacter arachoides TaxID=1850444 RepID=A0A845A016_9SPHN|nr:hypothetical protein [Aurantiacibacter arachoides]MXO92327.1 hypothetical protein [Aurantiacibacter arachoides]GGD58059.1 hypothetical protein GCM10011411_17640 [Aurantiacibacter arachoides]
MKAMRKRLAATTGAALVMILPLVAIPAQAQADQRLQRLEQQISALQRAVFPGGDERYFQPEITPQQNPQTTDTSPSTSALTGVLERLESIEQQVARLTAATEVNENALSAMEARLAALEGGRAAVSAQPGSISTPSGAIATPGAGSGSAALPSPPPQGTPAPTPTPAPAATPSPARVAAVAAITKPVTGDQGEDEYTYGFRLWDAGFFPEAQQQLALYLERYPSHRMASYGRNLLGRAFLDAGDARGAATHFFENYQNDPQGARAGDSLLFLAQSMIALGDTRRACIALAEFGDTYAALATGRLSTTYAGLNGRVDCD